MKQKEKKEQELKDMDTILRYWSEYPFMGYRRISVLLSSQGERLTEKRVRTLMEKMELKAIYPKPCLSKNREEHEKYPYLLKNKDIRYPNLVWASDITYIKMKGGSHAYLTVVMDWYSRKILTWNLSNTLDKASCVDVLKEALNKYGIPAIFNTDQGSQYTSNDFLSILKENHVQISMNGKGRALDNINVERFFRSIKYEKIFLNEYQSMEELRNHIRDYMIFYNSIRPHQSLFYQTPDEMVQSFINEKENKNAA